MPQPKAVLISIATIVFALNGSGALAQPTDPIRANELSAVGALRAISTAQALYREGDMDQNNLLDYAPNLTALAQTHLIDQVLGSGVKSGYRFTIVASLKKPEFQWLAIATPVSGETGERSFATNHTGVIYQALKPFVPRADCRIKGVPLGDPLPGWVRARSKPEGPWGEALRTALRERAFPYRSRSRQLFLGPGDRLRAASVSADRKGRTTLQVGEVDFTAWRCKSLVEASFDDQGRLLGLAVKQGGFPLGHPKVVGEAKRSGTTVALSREGAKRRTLNWAPNTVTLQQALYLLPRVNRLPRTLTLNLAVGGVPEKAPLKIARAEDGTVRLRHPRLGSATVRVKKGRITSIKAFDGTTWKAVSGKEARETLRNTSRASLVEALATAKRSGDVSAWASQAAALGGLRILSTAQAQFRETDSERDRALDYASSLEELIAAKLVDGALLKRTGYSFTVCHGSKVPEFRWMAIAAPPKPGGRYFVVNHLGAVYHSDKPIKLDRVDCTIPKGLKPVGR